MTSKGPVDVRRAVDRRHQAEGARRRERADNAVTGHADVVGGLHPRQRHAPPARTGSQTGRSRRRHGVARTSDPGGHIGTDRWEGPVEDSPGALGRRVVTVTGHVGRRDRCPAHRVDEGFGGLGVDAVTVRLPGEQRLECVARGRRRRSSRTGCRQSRTPATRLRAGCRASRRRCGRRAGRAGTLSLRRHCR